MRIKDMFTRHRPRSLEFVEAACTVREAAEKLSQTDVRALLVLDSDRLVGIVTSRDLLRHLVSGTKHAFADPVSRAMTSDVITVGPDDTLTTAKDLFTRHRIHHLPVTSDGRPLGVLTIADVLHEHLVDERSFTTHLQVYMHGPHAKSQHDVLPGP